MIGEIDERAAASASRPRPAPAEPTPQAAPAPPPPVPAAPRAEPMSRTEAVPLSKPAAADRSEEVVRMTMSPRTSARRLVQAQHETASLTTFNEVDMTRVIDLRASTRTVREGARHQARLHVVLREGVRRRAASCSPASTPRSSAATSSTRSTTTSASPSATPKGLVVPVLRDCGRASFAEIEKGDPRARPERAQRRQARRSRICRAARSASRTAASTAR